MQPSVGRDIGARHEEALFQGNHAREIQEKAFTCAEPADDKPDACPAVAGMLKIVQDRSYFGFPSHLNVVKAYPRNDSSS